MPTSPHSEIMTGGVRIHAAAQYLPQESDPDQSRFVYAYKITMINEGDQTVRLLSRHWVIIDSERRQEEVRGPGVVGEFPKLTPGESYSYISYCPLRTRWGTMEGSYAFETDDGDRVEAAIARFFLVPSAPPLELKSEIQ